MMVAKKSSQKSSPKAEGEHHQRRGEHNIIHFTLNKNDESTVHSLTLAATAPHFGRKAS